MNDTPKVFIGTMHTCEGDFEECIKRVQEQEGVIVTHHLVSGLGEKDAHNALWHAWREQQNDHDLFVKVDADTILASKTTLAEMCAEFKNNPLVTGMQAPLHDYMTDGFINGLNAFSPKVIFHDTKDELYCDRHVDVNHDIVLREKDLPETLLPAGYHCHHSTEIQAFHYGLHRMLKGQTSTIVKVFGAWLQHHDRIRAFALIGGRLSERFVKNRKFNYSDLEFQAAYKEAGERYNEYAGHIALGQLDKIT